MIDIDYLKYQDQLKLKEADKQRLLFDSIRQKWLVLQPEELVRQLVILYLQEEKGVNKNRIAIERGLVVNKLQKRCDILVYDQKVKPYLLVECKAPAVKINQDTFKQIAWYNMPLKVPYLMVTNGRFTFCCMINHEKGTFEFLNEVPIFSS